MPKFVITGGPGVGKTTTLLEIQKLGHRVVPEAARQIITQEQQKKEGILPWTNLFVFQQLVTKLQLELEDGVGKEIAFLDRGYVDNFAYCKVGNILAPQELVALKSIHKYDGVFVLDPLPHYNKDDVRKEDAVFAQALHEAIMEVYHEQGYSPIRVPVLSPEERARFILKHTSQ